MDIVERLREATRGSEWEGRLYIVGGTIRDRLLGRPSCPDLDIVVEGDALEVAHRLYDLGLSDHRPVVYPRFGTARITYQGAEIELASARAESYDGRTRKPEVRPATLEDDILRRDFTMNTLVMGLHDGIIEDKTGYGMADIRDRLIRTPLDPSQTFADDPLRMLRAIRFAVALDFTIVPETWLGICEQAGRIDLMHGVGRIVSAERVRDEFFKTIGSPDPASGLRMLQESGLLRGFLPELSDMVGVGQNAWHSDDVWEHTLRAVAALPAQTDLAVRLGVLFHDVGKPATRTEDQRGVHFYEHEKVGAQMTRVALQRLCVPGDLVRRVGDLVALHMRLGQMRPGWSRSAVHRLVRDVGDRLADLETIARADTSAMGPDAEPTDIDMVMERIDEANAELNAARITSPLSGTEIMQLLGLRSGPAIGSAKEFLINEIIEGRLSPGDKALAGDLLAEWYSGYAATVDARGQGE